MKDIEAVKLKTPLSKDNILKLKAGAMVLLSGKVYTARDAAHKKFIELLDSGESFPFPIEGAVIYYVGPTPAPPDRVIGSAGPTTSSRMDKFTPRLYSLGLGGTIGKGERSLEVKEALIKYEAVYFAATGGVGAMLSRYIKSAEVIAYPELGTEAVMELVVEDFPAITAIDAHGGDIFEMGRAEFEVGQQR